MGLESFINEKTVYTYVHVCTSTYKHIILTKPFRLMLCKVSIFSNT